MTLAEFEKLLDERWFPRGIAFRQRVLDAFAAKCAEAEKLPEEPKPMIGFGELIDQYLAKKITWDELFRKTAALGYKPTGLYEIARLIRAAEPSR